MSDERLSVLNIGFTRYRLPLEPSQRKKFRLLARAAKLHVVGVERPGSTLESPEDVELHLVPMGTSAAGRFVAVCRRALRVGRELLRRGELDLILCEGVYEGLVGIVLRRSGGRRPVLAVEVHGDWIESPFLYRTIPLASWVRPALAAWGSFVLRRADLIRVVSRTLEQKVGEIVPRARPLVFPTYSDLELFLSTSPPELDAEPGEPPTLLYVGALSPLKGIRYLLAAMETVWLRHPSARLLLVGDGEERGIIEETARAAGRSSQIEVLGAVPAERVREYLLASDVLVLPSLSEGLPRVILEAMACARPVVATSVGSISEAVEDGVTGHLVPPADADALAARLLQVLDDREGSRALGRRGRAIVEERFGPERFEEGYRALFSEARRLLVHR